jgi:hypothetical protein
VKPVKAPFILDVQKNDHTTGKPERESGKIDKGEAFVPNQIPKCDLQIIL